MALRTESGKSAPPDAARKDRPGRNRRRRVIAVTVYGLAFVAYWKVIGLPTDPVLIFAFLWVAVSAWNAAAPWREHLRFARDWSPLIVILVGYNFSRGAADNLGIGVHLTEPIHADRWLAGWALAALVLVFVGGAEQWWGRRHRAALGAQDAEPLACGVGS